MQTFADITADKTLRDSRPIILERDEALISNFSGENFPAENLHQGMLCYRTDEQKIYLLKNVEGPSWHLVFDLNQTSTSQESINTAMQYIENKLNAALAIFNTRLDGTKSTMAQLETDVATLKIRKPNIFTQDIEGVEISDRDVGDELTLSSNGFVNRRRTVSSTEPSNPRAGDWWLKT